MKTNIPHSKPFVDSADINSVTRQIKSGMHATGKKTEEFEEAFSKFIGRKYARATTSGTMALFLALRALDVKEGDEVIIPSYVCQAVLNAVNYTKAKAVLADIDSEFDKGLNITSETIRSLITERTKAIIVPHMFGIPADIDSIKSIANDIPIIEDCAQALGAKYDKKFVGSFGDISIFSFYATKVLSTGQGGMIATNSELIKERLNNLTKYDKKDYYDISYNLGMTDIQAALGLSQLKKLNKFVKKRREIANKYDKAFKGKIKIIGRKNDYLPFRYLIVQKDLKQKEDMKLKIREKGIVAEDPIFKPLHQYLNLPKGQFKNTEKAHETVLSIPIYPNLTNKEVSYIIKSVLDVLKN